MRRKLFFALLALVVAIAPVVAVAQPAHAAPKSQGQVHVVRRGENLTVIAAHYGTTVNAIAKANGISNPNYIWVGQRLVIPGAGVTPQTVAPVAEAVPVATAGCPAGFQFAQVVRGAPFWAGPGEWVCVRGNPGYPAYSWAPYLSDTGAGYYSEHLSFGGVPLTAPAPVPEPEPWQPAPSEWLEVGLPELHLPNLTPPEIPWEEIKRTAGNAGKVIVFTAIGAFIVLTGVGMAIGGLAFPTAVVTAGKAVLIGTGAVIRLVFQGGIALARLLVVK